MAPEVKVFPSTVHMFLESFIPVAIELIPCVLVRSSLTLAPLSFKVLVFLTTFYLTRRSGKLDQYWSRLIIFRVSSASTMDTVNFFITYADIHFLFLASVPPSHLYFRYPSSP